MRPHVKEFVSIVANSLPIEEPIYEFGALQVPGQERFADLRPLFPGKEYVGADMREGLGVDRLLNLHDIDLASASVGTVICVDTLEHVEYPNRALEQIHRILKPNGLAVICSTMKFPIHSCPGDYWRFTPEAFKSILKPFSASFVSFAGSKDFPHTVIGIGFKGNVPQLSEFKKRCAEWASPMSGIQKPRTSLKRIVKLLTPPILYPILSIPYRSTERLFTRMRGTRLT